MPAGVRPVKVSAPPQDQLALAESVTGAPLATGLLEAEQSLLEPYSAQAQRSAQARLQELMPA